MTTRTLRTLKTKLWAFKNEWDEDYRYDTHTSDMSPHGWIHIKDVEVEFEEPTREELVVGNIAALRKEREATVASFSSKLHMIDEQIQNLLAITNEVRS